jgi:hypothetical protein
MKHALNFFTKKECSQIINLNKTYKDHSKNIDWYRNLYDENNRRKIGDSGFYGYYIPNAPKTRWIFDKIESFFAEAIGTELKSSIKGCQLYRYEAGDFFPKHIDLSPEYKNRRWNVGVHLNEGYEGGEYYCWEGDADDNRYAIVPKNTGTICVYHSRQLHEIKNITRGTRWSLVIKIHSEELNEKKSII